jgi:hypothetical protein
MSRPCLQQRQERAIQQPDDQEARGGPRESASDQIRSVGANAT